MTLAPDADLQVPEIKPFLDQQTNPTDNLDDCRFNISMDTTANCNLLCRHCWMDAIRAQGYKFQNETMSFDLFKKVADSFVNRCASFAVSCGYEPLLNKEFDKYIRYAVEAGLPDVHFFSNGTLLKQPMAERIVDAQPNRIILSLEGATEDTYVDIRRGAKFDKFLNALALFRDAKKKLNKTKPYIRLNWVAMPRNMDDLPALAELSKSHGVQEIYLLPHMRWRLADLSEESVNDMDVDDALEKIEKFRESCAAGNIRVTDEHLRFTLTKTSPMSSPENELPEDLQKKNGQKSADKNILNKIIGKLKPKNNKSDMIQPAAPRKEFLCTQPWNFFLITAAGTLLPCHGNLMDRVYGDFKTQTLEEMWDSETFKELRASLRGEIEPRSHCLKCHNFKGNENTRLFHEEWEMDAKLAAKVNPNIIPKK